MNIWIPCDADDPPPENTPMLVWRLSYLSGWVRYPACPVWIDEDWQDVGQPGKDFTHYMLVDAPQ